MAVLSLIVHVSWCIYRKLTITSTLICHLVESFYALGNQQQLPVVTGEDFSERIISRDCPFFMVLAVCAVGARYSCHRSVESTASGFQFDELLARECRWELTLGPYNKSDYLLRAQCLCILADHEMRRGRGAEAWCDIGLLFRT